MMNGTTEKDLAAIHVLLIGVSDYPNLLEEGDDDAPEKHLGLRKLSSPALTVYRIYEWLERHRNFLPLPIGSYRRLVSASSSEVAVARGLEDWNKRATLQNTLDAIEHWREDLARNRKSIGLFYFAGHGVKRERNDDFLLLKDFGKKSPRLLEHAIDSSSLIGGMAPSKEYPNIARQQLYFFDACRVKPSLLRRYEELETTSIWDRTELDEVDDRAMLTLFTTEPGAKAYGVPDDQSLFSHALIRCLNGAAAESPEPSLTKWSVTAKSLILHIQTQLDLVNQEYTRVQSVQFGKSPSRDFVLADLEQPPAVDMLLHLHPEAVRPWVRVNVLNAQDDPVWELPYPVQPLPYKGKLISGTYKVLARDEREHPEWGPQHWFLQATPRFNEWSLQIPLTNQTFVGRRH